MSRIFLFQRCHGFSAPLKLLENSRVRSAVQPVKGVQPHGGETEHSNPRTKQQTQSRDYLRIDVRGSCLAPLAFASHRYAAFHLLMPLFVCRVWRGDPHPGEHQALAWVRPARLGDYAMPPADAPLVAMLRDTL